MKRKTRNRYYLALAFALGALAGYYVFHLTAPPPINLVVATPDLGTRT